MQSEYQDLQISHDNLVLEFNKSEKEIEKLFAENELFKSKVSDAGMKSVTKIKSLKKIIGEEKIKFMDEEHNNKRVISALKEKYDSLFNLYTKTVHMLETLQKQKIEMMSA